MIKREITANAPKVGENVSATVTVACPENLAEAAKMWGEDVVMSKLMASVAIDVQGAIRRLLEGTKETPGIKPEEVPAKLADYKPKKSVDRMNPVERMALKIKEMSPEKKAAILAMLKEKAKA